MARTNETGSTTAVVATRGDRAGEISSVLGVELIQEADPDCAKLAEHFDRVLFVCESADDFGAVFACGRALASQPERILIAIDTDLEDDVSGALETLMAGLCKAYPSLRSCLATTRIAESHRPTHAPTRSKLPDNHPELLQALLNDPTWPPGHRAYLGRP